MNDNNAVYPLIAFGFTNFAASDFTATNLPAGVTGVFKILGGTTLVFDTTTLTPIEQWRLAHFGTSANVGPADPEADGLRNLDEYALGSDPLASSAAPLLTRVASRATLIFPRHAAATDVTFIRAKHRMDRPRHRHRRRRMVPAARRDLGTKTRAPSPSPTAPTSPRRRGDSCI